MRSGAREMMALRWSVVCLGFSRRRRSLDEPCQPGRQWSVEGQYSQRRVEGVNVCHFGGAWARGSESVSGDAAA